MKSSKSLTIKTSISSNKKKETFIKSYVELIKKLKFNNVSPQEAHDLIMKNKFQTNKRYFWTMEKISYYLDARFIELQKYAIKNKKWMNKKLSEERLSNALNNINQLKFDKEIIKAAKEGLIFSKRVDSCRKAVNGEGFFAPKTNVFKKSFLIYFPLKKFDARKEVQTLQKLVSEKKHSGKFIKQNWKPYSSTSDKLIKEIWVNNKKKLKYLSIYTWIYWTFDQGTIDFIK